MKKLLKDILYRSGLVEVIGDTSIEISSLTFNSKEVSKGALFIALKGLTVDGHSFIEAAIDSGATAIVCEDLPADLNSSITYIKVNNSSIALAEVSNNFFDQPSSEIVLVGITGTNGKTTTATLLFELFKTLGFKCGLISTIENRIANKVIDATHTTPDALKTNALLRQMLDEGCTHCFMEVSSHAIAQNRIHALDFNCAVFTNITHDHLDYHTSFAEYINAKKAFFDQLNEDAIALVNKDDKHASVMVQNCKASVSSFGLKGRPDFKTKIIENSIHGLHLYIDGQEISTKQIGSFNASNLTALYAIAVLLGEDKLNVLTAISNLNPVAGRFECIISPNNTTGIVDYAHTPDALKNVLDNINDIRSGNESLITVVGCGGDRDKGKRTLMAGIASEHSDKVILTSDNPRSEDPAQIIKDMEKGVAPHQYKKVISIVDRREAIKTAVSMSQANDFILIAGKGHEKYQEIKGVKHPFDDKQELTNCFKMYHS
ncbi:MAG: UDP-N-acetylmuramoyl-L-alanyl-D-glutamate--2,6-diaminopimelate ligase [Bacteroidia bacterium]|nr:UDP-N-acetylmuramoyl-L-alanyl-D-glutamate--2,6-diaminopimelate ligase [Bacteroidia bacterium]